MASSESPVPLGKPATVVTIVLNTNRRADTLECLASLAAQKTAATNRIVVLDNKSSDGSADAIRAAFPEVAVVHIEQDRGYAGNNNVGLRLALAQRPEWVLILNEDTVLDDRCLDRLVSVGNGDRRIGMVGPLVLHHSEPDVIQSAGGQLSRFWESIHIGANDTNDGQFTDMRLVDWISGCALLVRTELIDGIGLLDERFYYYWEETEWCVRASRAGWRIAHVPDALLWHKGVQRHYTPGPNVTYYNTRNRLLLMATHHAPLGAKTIAWLQDLRTLLSWTVRRKWLSMAEHRRAMVQALVDFLAGRWGVRVRDRRVRPVE